jgi:hypothetical protein
VHAWKKTFDSPGCLDSTYPRHFHIHNNDVRSESKGQLNGCLPVCGLTDDHQGFVVLKKPAEGLPKGSKIIDQKNAKRFTDARCPQSIQRRTSAHLNFHFPLFPLPCLFKRRQLPQG